MARIIISAQRLFAAAPVTSSSLGWFLNTWQGKKAVSCWCGSIVWCQEKRWQYIHTTNTTHGEEVHKDFLSGTVDCSTEKVVWISVAECHEYWIDGSEYSFLRPKWSYWISWLNAGTLLGYEQIIHSFYNSHLQTDSTHLPLFDYSFWGLPDRGYSIFDHSLWEPYSWGFSLCVLRWMDVCYLTPAHEKSRNPAILTQVSCSGSTTARLSRSHYLLTIVDWSIQYVVHGILKW